MLSSLLKQYNAIEQQRAVRVMDYNEMVEQKLATLMKRQNGESEADGDGFRSLSAIAEETVKEDPVEVLQSAKEEAEQVLREAEEKSQEILNLAKEQSEEILKQARETGRAEGYEEGKIQAKEELETEYQKKQKELEIQQQKLTEDYNREMKELEPKLLDVIVDVVERVFHIQFDDKKELLLYLVCNTMENIEGSHNFRVCVGDEQKTFLEKHKDEILDRVGHDMTLEILSDSTLEGNQCMIETETGVFNCSLGVQLENLIKDLRSLNS